MIEIVEVKTKKQIRDFIRFPWEVYKNDDNWVPPIIFDMKNTLNRKKHPFFEIGEAVFYIAVRDGKITGRITAHINSVHNEYNNANDGFFGFYECLEDEEASKMLFEAAENWLRDKGMNKIIGPENYTIYDEICFMIDGWEAEPSTPVALEMYNPRYYIDLLKKSGYDKEIDWYAFMVPADIEIKEVYHKIKERLIKKLGLTFRNIDMKRFNEDVEGIKKVVHGAWKDNWGHFPYTDKMFEHISKALKMFLDPRVCFIVEKEGEIVGCAVSFPDINPSVKKMNGRLFPFGWWHLLRATKNAIGLRTFLFGVIPEYRNKGIDIVMVLDSIINGTKAGYNWSECSLIVETNTKMIEPIEKWGGKPYKTYRLFSKKLK
ncbi:MAG: hypothetical protein KAR07_07185 [Spirochaetes bacterium]|nr:hypothetical protein [Spirochaetota bacterium]